MKKFTLYNLLNSSSVKDFDLLNKLKIYVISSSELWDRLTADVEEYYIHDIPYHLLRKKVYKAYYSENAIEVFKWKVMIKLFNVDMYHFKNGSVVLYKNFDNSGEVIIYKNKKIFLRKYYIDFDKAYNVFHIVTEWLEREIKDTIEATLVEIKIEFIEED